MQQLWVWALYARLGTYQSILKSSVYANVRLGCLKMVTVCSQGPRSEPMPVSIWTEGARMALTAGGANTASPAALHRTYHQTRLAVEICFCPRFNRKAADASQFQHDRFVALVLVGTLSVGLYFARAAATPSQVKVPSSPCTVWSNASWLWMTTRPETWTWSQKEPHVDQTRYPLSEWILHGLLDLCCTFFCQH